VRGVRAAAGIGVVQWRPRLPAPPRPHHHRRPAGPRLTYDRATGTLRAGTAEAATTITMKAG
jgi:hypothetical protein